MTVDMSTLKPGDIVVLRDGSRHEVVGWNGADGLLTTRTRRQWCATSGKEFQWWHTVTGHTGAGEECSGDVVQIIQAGASVVAGEALRHNEGKTPYGNLPLDLLDGAARVMAKGEVKYGRANYRKGYSDLLSPLHSLMRHVAAVQAALEQDQLDQGGPLYDAESGEAHVHHVITSAALLVQALRKKGVKV